MRVRGLGLGLVLGLGLQLGLELELELGLLLLLQLRLRGRWCTQACLLFFRQFSGLKIKMTGLVLGLGLESRLGLSVGLGSW